MGETRRVSIRPSTADIQKFGTPPQTCARKKIDFIPKSPWEQRLSEVASMMDPHRDALLLDPKKIDTPEKKAALYSDNIQMHLDQRIALFFQTALLCYGMPFHFESSGEAETQYGIAHGIKDGTTIHKYQAAHSSTFPTLYACNRQEKEKFDAGTTTTEPKKFVYCKLSSSDNLQNSTNSLPIEVNQCDSLIDFQVKEGTPLRDSAIGLINQVALKALDPVKATQKFGDLLAKRVTYIASRDVKANVKPFLGEYSKGIAEIRLEMKAEDYFSKLLSIKIEGENDRLRDIVYKKRYKIIQAEQLIDSRINERVRSCPIKTSGLTRDYIKFALLLISDAQEKRVLKRLFCKQSEQLDENAANQKRHNAFIKKIKDFAEKNKTELSKLHRDIRADIREAQNAERVFQSQLLEDLIYKVNGWTKSEFVDTFKQEHPGESMSPSMLSRLTYYARKPLKDDYKSPVSQRSKEMTTDKAVKCAQTLEVDAGIFFPCIFSSTQSL